MSSRTKSEGLIQTLSEMGLQHGNSLIVHSSFRSLQPFEGGPNDVIDAIIASVGPQGNVMFPTFNYAYPPPSPWYDYNETPARTGAIPECARQRPGAIRSLHPTHSVSVIGPDAVALTADHLLGRTFGRASPIDRLADIGGMVLLLGVGQVANSTIHVAEEYANIPKFGRFDSPLCIKIRMPDESIIEHTLDTSPSCSAAFEAASYLLRQEGQIRDGRIGNCFIQIMRGRDIIRSIAKALSDDPFTLTCANDRCRSCRKTQDELRKRGIRRRTL